MFRYDIIVKDKKTNKIKGKLKYSDNNPSKSKDQALEYARVLSFDENNLVQVYEVQYIEGFKKKPEIINEKLIYESELE
jgi:hypothetical protein